jgi:hypothetical protein
MDAILEVVRNVEFRSWNFAAIQIASRDDGFPHVIQASEPSSRQKRDYRDGHPILLWREACDIFGFVAERKEDAFKEYNACQDWKKEKVSSDWY